MKCPFFLITASILLMISCNRKIEKQEFGKIILEAPSIHGKQEYLQSPYVTAGNRLYMVGHQDGSFPELGWHIKGEMGGIWDHPIKLMDGFDVKLVWDNHTATLNNADKFTNYPMANVHHFSIPEKDEHK